MGVRLMRRHCVRVEDVEHGVDDVGDEVDVALAAPSPGVHAERLFCGEAEEEQFGVVDVELVRRLSLARALLQICVVSVGQRERNVAGCKSATALS